MQNSSLVYVIFFISIASILLIVIRKLLLLRQGKLIDVNNDAYASIKEDLQKLKSLLIVILKKISYFTLLITFKIHFITSSFLKRNIILFKKKLSNILALKKKIIIRKLRTKDISEFLNKISNYKIRIYKIKYKAKLKKKNNNES